VNPNPGKIKERGKNTQDNFGSCLPGTWEHRARSTNREHSTNRKSKKKKPKRGGTPGKKTHRISAYSKENQTITKTKNQKKNTKNE